MNGLVDDDEVRGSRGVDLEQQGTSLSDDRCGMSDTGRHERSVASAQADPARVLA